MKHSIGLATWLHRHLLSVKTIYVVFPSNFAAYRPFELLGFFDPVTGGLWQLSGKYSVMDISKYSPVTLVIVLVADLRKGALSVVYGWDPSVA